MNGVTKQSSNLGAKPGRGDLSHKLTELLDESRRLVQLKADWGRMPAGPLRTKSMKQIDEWFKGDGRTTKTDDRVSITFVAVQELWDAYGTVTKAILREGLKPDTIRRLKRQHTFTDKSELGENSSNKLPDDDDIPF